MKGLESTLFLFRPLTKLPHLNTGTVAIGDRDSGEIYSWERGQKGDGDSGYGKAGTVAIGDRDSGEVYSWDRGQKGDGDSGYGRACTVAIGDRDSERVYSWDKAEGLEQQAQVLWLY